VYCQGFDEAYFAHLPLRIAEIVAFG